MQPRGFPLPGGFRPPQPQFPIPGTFPMFTPPLPQFPPHVFAAPPLTTYGAPAAPNMRPPGVPFLPPMASARPAPQRTSSLSSAGDRQLTVYVGHIGPDVPDDIIKQLLMECGRVLKWTRTQDPLSHKLSPFGFCEFDGMASVWRASTFLHDAELAGQSLVVKCPENAKEALQQWHQDRVAHYQLHHPGVPAAEAIRRMDLEDANIKSGIQKLLAEAHQRLQRDAERRKFIEEQQQLSLPCPPGLLAREAALKESKAKADATSKDATKEEKEEEEGTTKEKTVQGEGSSSTPKGEETKGKEEMSTTSLPLEKEEKEEEGKDAGPPAASPSDEPSHPQEPKASPVKEIPSSEVSSAAPRPAATPPPSEDRRRAPRVASLPRRSEAPQRRPERPACLSSDYRVHYKERDRLARCQKRQRDRQRELRRREKDWERYEEKVAKERLRFTERQEERAAIPAETRQMLQEKDLAGEWWNFEGPLPKRRRDNRRAYREDEYALDEEDREREEHERQQQEQLKEAAALMSSHSLLAAATPASRPLLLPGHDEDSALWGVPPAGLNLEGLMNGAPAVRDKPVGFSIAASMAPSEGSSSMMTLEDMMAGGPERSSGVSVFGGYEEEGGLFSRRHKPLTKLDAVADRTNLEHQADVMRRQKEMVKRIGELIPTSKEEIFSFEIDWAILEKNGVYESKLRPWISKRVVELLGKEEPTMVDFVMDRVVEQTKASDLLSELTELLEGDAEPFLTRMWRILIFEHLRLREMATQPPPAEE